MRWGRQPSRWPCPRCSCMVSQFLHGPIAQSGDSGLNCWSRVRVPLTYQLERQGLIWTSLAPFYRRDSLKTGQTRHWRRNQRHGDFGQVKGFGNSCSSRNPWGSCAWLGFRTSAKPSLRKNSGVMVSTITWAGWKGRIRSSTALTPSADAGVAWPRWTAKDCSSTEVLWDRH